MTSPIGGISFPSAIPAVGGLSGTTGADAAAPATAAGDGGFAAVLASSVDRLQSVQSTSDALAVQAATGDLRDVHDYMIAANEAKLATEMVVTLKNKAVEAFNEIMRMPV
ncbi:flagellar hook-basal body complex protein FliE [Geodermatophilus sp. DF01-2]|uniref:flagellar hook-basal body complex protein FliE n=1 Tax=Geodermatophilus sp. DF01-2 TaxID=2559610 RepID=UPI0010742FEA|nr:flagellar hook-basal body complex protein FliE [Geodermatophilus sp. DF01_2]TFV64160.1 flagellar hook-basal body complex protein FliE [Geodermatophilus sp. DF01_2]